jgi:hypothetical protein
VEVPPPFLPVDAKEYSGTAPPAWVGIKGQGESAVVTVAPTLLQKINAKAEMLQRLLFQRQIWVWAYFAVFTASVVQLAKHRGHHFGAFLLCLLTMMPIGASLLTCLVEEAFERYSYPTQFIYYLSVALMPLLWMRTPCRGAERELTSC